MPTELSDHPEHLHRILRRYSTIMGQLDLEYVKSVPTASPSEFKEQFFSPILESVQQIQDIHSLLDDPATLNNIINELVEGRDRIESDIAFIHLSCVYAVASMVALERKQQDSAWDLLCEAAYRLGGVFTTNRAGEVFTETVVNLYKKARGEEAAAKRHSAKNELRARAIAILKEQQWKSQAYAAEKIAERLQKRLANVSSETSRTPLKIGYERCRTGICISKLSQALKKYSNKSKVSRNFLFSGSVLGHF